MISGCQPSNLPARTATTGPWLWKARPTDIEVQLESHATIRTVLRVIVALAVGSVRVMVLTLSTRSQFDSGFDTDSDVQGLGSY